MRSTIHAKNSTIRSEIVKQVTLRSQRTLNESGTERKDSEASERKTNKMPIIVEDIEDYENENSDKNLAPLMNEYHRSDKQTLRLANNNIAG